MATIPCPHSMATIPCPHSMATIPCPHSMATIPCPRSSGPPSPRRTRRGAACRPGGFRTRSTPCSPQQEGAGSRLGAEPSSAHLARRTRCGQKGGVGYPWSDRGCALMARRIYTPCHNHARQALASDPSFRPLAAEFLGYLLHAAAWTDHETTP